MYIRVHMVERAPDKIWMLKSGTFELRLKVKSVHHIVRSNHTQFQENAEEPVQLSTLHSMVATRFSGSNISVIATSRPVTDVFPNVRVKRVGKKVLLPSPPTRPVLLPSLARRALCPRPLK